MKSGYLQGLKAYDPETFDGKRQPESLIDMNTTKEAILGFEIAENPSKAYYDEFIIYGKRKFCHVGVQRKGKKLTAKLKAVSVAAFNKNGEKSLVSIYMIHNISVNMNNK